VLSKQKLPEGLERIPIRKWENKHENFVQKLVEGASFKVRNPASIEDGQEQYNATTCNLQWLIRHAIKNKTRLRALGSGWSLSKVGVTHGGLIDTKSLNLMFVLREKHIGQAYREAGKGVADALFVQSGTSIRRINTQLEKESHPKRSLQASGASDGQTIAGALSTGTHGAAFNTGSIQEQVTGLHLIVGPDRHVYLERASYPVVSNEFINWIGAEIIRDDIVFNAALVSFGGFGIIHGIMLETSPIFLLEGYRLLLPYTQGVTRAMNEFDFSEIETPLPLDVKDKELYHFGIDINPHSFEKDNKDKVVYVDYKYKTTYREEYPKENKLINEGFHYGDDTLGLIQTLLDSIQGFGFPGFSIDVVPSMVNLLFPAAYGSEANRGPSYGTLGETFAYSNLRGKAFSAAFGFDAKHASRVVEELIELNQSCSFPGAFRTRFVKGSKALLGFTQYEKTCVLELDGVDSKASRAFFCMTWELLEQIECPFTIHWGKFNFMLNAQRLRKMYGKEKVNQWIASRNFLLDPATREVFTNELMEKCDLNIELTFEGAE